MTKLELLRFRSPTLDSHPGQRLEASPLCWHVVSLKNFSANGWINDLLGQQVAEAQFKLIWIIKLLTNILINSVRLTDDLYQRKRDMSRSHRLKVWLYNGNFSLACRRCDALTNSAKIFCDSLKCLLRMSDRSFSEIGLYFFQSASLESAETVKKVDFVLFRASLWHSKDNFAWPHYRYRCGC